MTVSESYKETLTVLWEWAENRLGSRLPAALNGVWQRIASMFAEADFVESVYFLRYEPHLRF